MKLHFSGMRVGLLESWHGLGYGQKPLSSALIILFYKILGCDYSLLQPESSSWKAVCPKEGGIYSRVEDVMGYSGKILLYSWYTWNMDLRVWTLDSAAAVSSGWRDRNASSWGPSQINWLRNSGDGARQALICPSVFFWCTLRVETLWSGRRKKLVQPDSTLQRKDAGVQDLNRGWGKAPMRTPASAHCRPLPHEQAELRLFMHLL